MKNKLTQKRLKELLHYDPDTGIWKWISPKARRVKAGDIAGYIKSNGYRGITVDNILYLSSRLAHLYMEGYFPENDMDHINRIRHDDRWCNIRHVSRQCNTRNCGIASNNTSGITGVSWQKATKKWLADIRINKKQIRIGCYEKIIDAVKARWEGEKKYNFPNCNTTSSAYKYLKAQQ